MDTLAIASRQVKPAPRSSLGQTSPDVHEGQPLTDLGRMLARLAPELRPGIWVYAILPPGAPTPASAAALVREIEGPTVVLRAEDAEDLGLAPLFCGRWITLHVHSSLSAVGLTARVATELAEAGIPANLLAGFCHDHLMVPVDLADQALACLRRLQEDAEMQSALREGGQLFFGSWQSVS